MGRGRWAVLGALWGLKIGSQQRQVCAAAGRSCSPLQTQSWSTCQSVFTSHPVPSVLCQSVLLHPSVPAYGGVCFSPMTCDQFTVTQMLWYHPDRGKSAASQFEAAFLQIIILLFALISFLKALSKLIGRFSSSPKDLSLTHCIGSFSYLPPFPVSIHCLFLPARPAMLQKAQQQGQLLYHLVILGLATQLCLPLLLPLWISRSSSREHCVTTQTLFPAIFHHISWWW